MALAEIGTWIWLAIIVIGFLSKLLKKKQESPTEQDTYQEDQEKPISFEDLLEQINSSKKQEQPAAPATETPDYSYEQANQYEEEEQLDTTYVADDANAFEKYEEVRIEDLKKNQS